MRKHRITVFIVALAVTVMCTGCEEKSTATAVARQISFVADISAYEKSYTCNVFVFDDKTEVELTAPEALRAFKFSVSDGIVKSSLSEISASNEKSECLDFSCCSVLYEILKSSHGKPLSNGDKNPSLRGRISGGREFSLTASPSGLPLSAELIDGSFKVAFKNVSLIE